MKLISHRGNIDGPNKDLENRPLYIERALQHVDYVEIDLWDTVEGLYLGHDEPQIPIAPEWLLERKERLVIHCKNLFAIGAARDLDLHYFWHENDTCTLTSLNWVWCYPGVQAPLMNATTVAVMPGAGDLSTFDAICSDYVLDYEKSL